MYFQMIQKLRYDCFENICSKAIISEKYEQVLISH
jgi:hypothetical protein